MQKNVFVFCTFCDENMISYVERKVSVVFALHVVVLVLREKEHIFGKAKPHNSIYSCPFDPSDYDYRPEEDSQLSFSGLEK